MTNFYSDKFKNYKKNAETAEKVNVSRPQSWQSHIQADKAPTFVETLASRLFNSEKDYIKIVEKRVPTAIDHPNWRTAPEYRLSNLPKVQDHNYRRLNFSFGKSAEQINENFEQMLNSEKIIVRSYAHQYKEKGKDFCVLRLYSIAPFLENENLPLIYRLDILAIPSDPSFYGLKAVAMVGGCIDGECPLIQIKSGDTPLLYKYKSGYTSYDVDFEQDAITNHRFEIIPLGNIKDLISMTDEVFKRCNIVGVLASINQDKVWKIAQSLQIDKVGKNLYNSISGAEFIKTYLDDGVSSNAGFERQFVRDCDTSISQDLQ